MRTHTRAAAGSDPRRAPPDYSDRRRRARRGSRTGFFCGCRDKRSSPRRSAARPVHTARDRRSFRRTQRGELLERRAFLFGRMAFVIALDQRLDDANLEVGGCSRQRTLNLIESQHDLEVVLELGLGDLGVALELVAYPAVEAAGIARGEIARDARPRSPGLDYVRQASQRFGETRKAVGRSPGLLGRGQGGPRRGQLPGFVHIGTVMNPRARSYYAMTSARRTRE